MAFLHDYQYQHFKTNIKIYLISKILCDLNLFFSMASNKRLNKKLIEINSSEIYRVFPYY